METSQEMDTIYEIVRQDPGTSAVGAAAAGPTLSPLLNRRTENQQTLKRRRCGYFSFRQYQQKMSEASALDTNKDNVLRVRDSLVRLTELLQSSGLDDATCEGERHAPGEEGQSPGDEGHARVGESSTSGGEVQAPVEKGSISREEGSISMEEGSISMEEGSISMEEGSISMEEGSISMEEGSISRKEGHTSGLEVHILEEEWLASEIQSDRLEIDKVSLEDSDYTTDSMKFIRKEWGNEGTMHKIYRSIKSGSSPVDVHSLVSEGPVVCGQRRLIAARCFASILNLKQHGFIKISKNSETLEIENIELGNKVVRDKW